MSTVPPTPPASPASPASDERSADASTQVSVSGTGQQREPLFGTRPPEPRETPWMAWGIAGGIVVLLLLSVLVFTHHKAGPAANTILPPAAYASSLPISGVEMSESTSLSGGKSTFVDGHIRNTGTATVTAATVQVLFANDEAMPPQVETLTLSLIRTRQPYVDIEPVSAAPIAPGQDREFRLIFEDVSVSWNQQVPEIRVVKVATQ